MSEGNGQAAVFRLLNLVDKVTGDLDQKTMDQVVAQLDSVISPVSKEDASRLLSLLPESGDPAQGVNWTIMHAIESSPAWPIWDALNQPAHEWFETLEVRLNNAGIFRPADHSK